MLSTKLLADDWINILGDLITGTQASKIEALPKTPLLSGIKLKYAFGENVAKRLIRKCGVLPEIDIEGSRRCVYIKDGVRCENYSSTPCCDEHFEEAQMLSNHFRSNTLRKQYEELMGSKHKLQLDSEVSMMRLMLGILVSKLNDNAITIEHIVAVTQLCEKITGVVDKMSKMNSVTPETVDIMMSKVVDIIALYVEPDKLAIIADAISKVVPTYNVCDIQVMPGDTYIEGGQEREPISIHKRALIEIAAQMKVTGDEADATM